MGGATFIEIFLNKALRDGTIEEAEKVFLGTTYLVTRVGLVMAALSGAGFIALYISHEQTFKLLNPVLWAKLSIIFIMLLNAILLQAKKMPLALGSSLSLVSWYFAMILGIFSTNAINYSFLAIMFAYGVCVIAFVFLLERLRGGGAKKTVEPKPLNKI